MSLAAAASAAADLANLSVRNLGHAFAEGRETGPQPRLWERASCDRCYRSALQCGSAASVRVVKMSVAALMQYTAHSLRCYWAVWFPVLAHVADQLGPLLSEADFTETMPFHIDCPSLHGSALLCMTRALSSW